MKILNAAILALILSSCAIVGPNQMAVKQKLGRILDDTYNPGPVGFNPFTTKVVMVNINTSNMEVSIGLPSKEGLTIESVVSVLYHIDSEKIKELLTNTGYRYEETVVFPVFRSAAADVTARFFAKDLHSGERSIIEKEIKERMKDLLADRGIIIEAVLMKSIKLPPGLYSSIESKLEAEQDVQRMQFELEQEKLEAQRKEIEATGVKNSQQIISEGLDSRILEYMRIEALKALYNSPNSKIIIGNQNSNSSILIDSK